MMYDINLLIFVILFFANEAIGSVEGSQQKYKDVFNDEWA